MDFDKLTLEKRQTESSRILEKYDNRVPVIVSKARNSKLNDIDKKKFIVPSDLTVGQFIYVIRKRISLKPCEGLFLFINNALPPTSSTMGTIYSNNKNEDGFLYIQYEGENTFG